jgi:hypothetical protein
MYIDTLWLSQDQERVVMMNILTNDTTIIVLNNGGAEQKISSIPAVTNTTVGITGCARKGCDEVLGG